MITEVFISVDRDEVYRATLPPGEYVIGRDPDAQIRIQHPTISRRHAKLIVEEDHLVLSDLDSGNGTLIEENPVVGPSHFYEGQTARLGDVLMRARQKVTPDSLPPSIANYRKGDVVASGGMGAIHEARQSAMGRKVAMKVMLREGSENGLRRFINEARITGMLEHPNIVPVHELGVDADGRAFYTMKFVHGTTLAEVLAGLRTGSAEAAKKYPLAFLLTVFQKVCDAIAFAHSRGVHHRDLKPENVMIGDFGEVLVMDWGLSKETGFASDAEDVLPGSPTGDGAGWRTMEGSVLGTPAYMSPEQARGEVDAVDARSDIYCLGAILHEILYLQPPASGANAYEIVDKVGRGELDPVRDMERPHWPDGRVPLSLEAVRRKAMAFDAGQRYRSVTDLQSDIAAYQSGFATSAEEAGVAKQALLFFKRNRGVSLAVLGGLLLLAAVSLVFIWRLQDRIAEIQKLAARQKTLLGDLQVALDGKEEALRQVRSEAAAKEQALALANTAKSELEGQNLKLEKALEDVKKSDKRAETAEVGNEEAARKFFDSAWDAVREGNFDKAMQGAVAALERAPEKHEYRELKADLLQSSGRLAEAAEEYLLAIAHGAGDRAKENLRWCEARQRSGLAPEEAYRSLAALLADQGRDFELVFLDKARRGEAAPRDADGDSLEIPGTLRALAGEGADERFVLSPDGSTVGLDLSGLPVDSLEDFRILKLRSLDLRGTQVTDLSALEGKPLEELQVAAGTRDLSPLRVDRLRALDLRGSQVADLGPLAGASNLEKLWLDNTPVQSLEPLRGKPLKFLSLDGRDLKNFDVIGSLASLEELVLPRHAAGVPVAGLPLKKVRHPRFQEIGEMSGDLFKELSARTDEAWRKWRGELFKLGVSDRERERVTVVREVWPDLDPSRGAFDLDLRGTGVSDLRPLKHLPIHRLYIDTAAQPLDLQPLDGHGFLKHLVLTGANVPSLQGVLEPQGLKSIVLSADTADVHRLHNRTNIPWAGYVMDVSQRLPTTTTKQLFGGRDVRSVLRENPKTGRYTDVAFLFDDPGMDAQSESNRKKWQVEPPPKHGSRRPVWHPDPPAEGGMGGGYLQFFEREEDGQTSHFVLPREFANQRQKLYGSSVGFELRTEGDGVRSEGGEFIIRSRSQDLCYNFSGRHPSKDWRRFRVPLKEGDGWTVGSPTGAPATAEDMQSALASAREFLIRAEYFKEGSYERTSLDNVVFWDPVETNQRVGEEIAEERAKNNWIAVESRPLEDWLRKAGLTGESADADRERVRILEYRGRRLPLLVGAVSVAQPGRVTIRPGQPAEPRTLVRFAARGVPGSPGVRVRILQGEALLREVAIADQWTEVHAELPRGTAGEDEVLCVLEVVPNGDLDPYCVISGLELVPPSRRK